MYLFIRNALNRWIYLYNLNIISTHFLSTIVASDNFHGRWSCNNSHQSNIFLGSLTYLVLLSLAFIFTRLQIYLQISSELFRTILTASEVMDTILHFICYISFTKFRFSLQFIFLFAFLFVFSFQKYVITDELHIYILITHTLLIFC